MILKKRSLLLFILVSCCFLKLAGQNQGSITKLAILAKNYNAFSQRYVQERVYLHMDNSAYFLGDTLWFKAYVTSSSFHRLSPESWILYTELVSPEGEIVETKKLPLVNGHCHGHFDINSSYLSGFYEVRAYTRAMQSFGEDHIFSRVIPVFKQPTKAGNYNQLLSDYRHYRDSERSRKKKETISLSFYPEGGHLLKGVQNTLAIKAVDSEGKDVFVKGDILDRSDVKIGSFTTEHRGMCRFTFTPNSKKYKARVMLGEEKYEFDLPDIEESGIIATIDSYSSDDSVSLKLLKSGEITFRELGMAISCRGQLYYLNILNGVGELPLDIKIPKAQLSNGVHEFILFDPLGTPLIERKFFISLTDGKYVNKQAYTRTVSIAASDVKNEYKPNEKIGLNFIVKDEKGDPVQTSFSLSIRDPHGNIDTYNNSDNVLTHLLLSSEVKGFIPNAGYYFESDDQGRRKELDLLLMVQGWSRYPWKRLANVEPFNEEQYVEKGFIISGAVYKAKAAGSRKEPIVNSPVKMILKSVNNTYKGECITDEAGRFNFMFEDIYYNWRASIYLDSKKMRNRCVIVLDENKPVQFKNYSFYEKYVPIVDIIVVDSVANNHILEGVEVISRRKRRVVDTIPIRENLLVNANELINLLPELGIDTRLELNVEYILSYILYKHNLKKGTAKCVTTKRNNSISVEDMLINYPSLFKEVVIYRDVETRNKNRTGLTFVEYRSLIGRSLMPIEHWMYSGIYMSAEYPDRKRVCVDLDISLDGLDEDELSKLDKYIIRTSNTFTHANIRSLGLSSRILDSLGERGTDIATADFINVKSFEAGKMFNFFDSPDYVIEFVKHTSLSDIGETSPSHRFMRFMGYSESKEFYSVDYSKKSLPPSDDYRRTLYWNPNVKTDDSGKAKIEFYNNSRCKDLNIDAQTITLKGEVGVYEKKRGDHFTTKS